MRDVVDSCRVTVGIALHRLADWVIGRRLLAAADRLYVAYSVPSDYPLEPDPDERRTW